MSALTSSPNPPDSWFTVFQFRWSPCFSSNSWACFCLGAFALAVPSVWRALPTCVHADGWLCHLPSALSSIMSPKSPLEGYTKRPILSVFSWSPVLVFCHWLPNLVASMINWLSYISVGQHSNMGLTGLIASCQEGLCSFLSRGESVSLFSHF